MKKTQENRRVRRPIKMSPSKGSIRILSEDTDSKKKIELQIAKKEYEIALLKIELKYPKKADTSKGKIGFDIS